MSRPGPRRVAYDVLEAVRADGAYANLLLPTRIARAGLSDADARLATELTYGALRLAGYYDAVVADAARRPAVDIDPAVLDVLRLGVHQLLATRVPPHAAVNESVALAQATGSRRASGFVNAVLRTVSSRSAEAWRERIGAGIRDAEERRAVLAAHPRWIVDALRDALAAEGAEDELPALLDADNAPPRVNAVVLPFRGVDTDGLTPNRYSPIGYLDAPLGGAVRVQDEGSQLAALAIVTAREIAAGERWLDLCAGPGGKAAILAAYAEHHGASLVANEVVPARAGLVRTALRGAGLNRVEVTERDGRDFASEPGGFDRILLDAPCTGLGALRRRPEARWRKTVGDLDALARLQAELLDAAVAALRPGGVLGYVTCSPHLAETRDQVAAALVRHPELRELDTRAALGRVAREPLGLRGPGTAAQLWPHRHGTDAMFIQLLTRV